MRVLGHRKTYHRFLLRLSFAALASAPPDPHSLLPDQKGALMQSKGEWVADKHNSVTVEGMCERRPAADSLYKQWLLARKAAKEVIKEYEQTLPIPSGKQEDDHVEAFLTEKRKPYNNRSLKKLEGHIRVFMRYGPLQGRVVPPAFTGDAAKISVGAGADGNHMNRVKQRKGKREAQKGALDATATKRERTIAELSRNNDIQQQQQDIEVLKAALTHWPTGHDNRPKAMALLEKSVEEAMARLASKTVQASPAGATPTEDALDEVSP